MTRWRFVCWSDGSTENPRRIDLVGDAELSAIYEEAKFPWKKALGILAGPIAALMAYTAWKGRKK